MFPNYVHAPFALQVPDDYAMPALTLLLLFPGCLTPRLLVKPSLLLLCNAQKQDPVLGARNALFTYCLLRTHTHERTKRSRFRAQSGAVVTASLLSLYSPGKSESRLYVHACTSV